MYLAIANSSCINNTASTGSGGCIKLPDRSIVKFIQNTVMTDNFAACSGGVLHTGKLTHVEVSESIFSRNKVEDTSAPKHKRATYEEEVRKVNTQRSVTTPQMQDA